MDKDVLVNTEYKSQQTQTRSVTLIGFPETEKFQSEHYDLRFQVKLDEAEVEASNFSENQFKPLSELPNFRPLYIHQYKNFLVHLVPDTLDFGICLVRSLVVQTRFFPYGEGCTRKLLEIK